MFPVSTCSLSGSHFLWCFVSAPRFHLLARRSGGFLLGSETASLGVKVVFSALLARPDFMAPDDPIDWLWLVAIGTGFCEPGFRIVYTSHLRPYYRVLFQPLCSLPCIQGLLGSL